MNKKVKAVCVFCFLLIISPVFAHSPILIIEDSDESYVYVKAGFSNGQDASGMALYVKSKFDNRIIETLKFPKNSQLKVKIPKEPYYMMFDGGPGHKAVKSGPAPKEGFTEHPEAEKNNIPGQGVPLWLIVAGISISIVIIVFASSKLFKQK